MTNKMKFNYQIRAKLKSEGRSIKWLANKLGENEKTVYSRLARNGKWNAEQVMVIVDLLNIKM